MAKYNNFLINDEFLSENPNAMFVFGDNCVRIGHGGAAAFREHPQAYGFITKKYPNNSDESFYHPLEYKSVFQEECDKLILEIKKSIGKTWYISKLGGGLANRYFIWETVIKNGLINQFSDFDNVVFLWDE